MDNEWYKSKEKKRQLFIPLDSKISLVHLYPLSGLEPLWKKGRKYLGNDRSSVTNIKKIIE